MSLISEEKEEKLLFLYCFIPLYQGICETLECNGHTFSVKTMRGRY